MGILAEGFRVPCSVSRWFHIPKDNVFCSQQARGGVGLAEADGNAGPRLSTN